MAAQYDISIDQGSNFDFWFQYLDEDNNGVTLAGYNAQLRIKKYKEAPYSDILVDIYGLTYGYTGQSSPGISGYGQIYLDKNYNNTTINGGIKISIGPKVTESLREGKYFYDFRIFAANGITLSQKLVEGRVTVNGSNTQ